MLYTSRCGKSGGISAVASRAKVCCLGWDACSVCTAADMHSALLAAAATAQWYQRAAARLAGEQLLQWHA
jgi:hypothetical protein